MKLEQAVAEMDELRTRAAVNFWSTEVTELTMAMSALTKLRNKRLPDMAPEMLAQRKAIFDVVLRIVKTELRRTLSELVKANDRWEKLDI